MEFLSHGFRDECCRVNAIDRWIEFGLDRQLRWWSPSLDWPSVETPGQPPGPLSHWAEPGNHIDMWEGGKGTERCDAKSLQQLHEIDQRQRVRRSGTR